MINESNSKYAQKKNKLSKFTLDNTQHVLWSTYYCSDNTNADVFNSASSVTRVLKWLRQPQNRFFRKHDYSLGWTPFPNLEIKKNRCTYVYYYYSHYTNLRNFSNVIGLAHTLVAREERMQYTVQIKLLLRSWLFIVVKKQYNNYSEVLSLDSQRSHL